MLLISVLIGTGTYDPAIECTIQNEEYIRWSVTCAENHALDTQGDTLDDVVQNLIGTADAESDLPPIVSF